MAIPPTGIRCTVRSTPARQVAAARIPRTNCSSESLKPSCCIRDFAFSFPLAAAILIQATPLGGILLDVLAAQIGFGKPVLGISRPGDRCA